LISSIYLGAALLEAFNEKLQAKLALIEQNEVRYEAYEIEDAEYVVVAFGTAARVAKTAVQALRREGVPVGLFRPITLWPFPEKQLTELADNGRVRGFLVTEMNAGQMLHDVRLAVGRGLPVKFYGRMGGAIPMPEEIETKIQELIATINQPAASLEGKNGHPKQ
jgi:2-oxoglutarate ferredoxin oxidoreductase subunit alpha